MIERLIFGQDWFDLWLPELPYRSGDGVVVVEKGE